MNLANRWQNLAYLTLILMGLVAGILLGTDVAHYIGSLKSAQGLELEVTRLEVIDDDNPRIHVRFRLRNNSPLEIQVVRYIFDLYLNRQRVGSSYSTYLGTDPNVDPAVYRDAAAIDQALARGDDVPLEFTLYIYPVQMEQVRSAQRSGSMSWFASTKFTVLLPHSREEDFVYLRANFDE